MTEAEKGEVLDVVQQVLRGMTVTLAVATGAPLPKFASLLQGFADNPRGLDPRAARMLLDLAQGLDMLGKAGHQPS